VQGLDPRGMQSWEIGPKLGVPFQGHTHNALNDARSLAGGMEAIAARGTKIRPAA
jgi:inhibitor of KinA sporulation pathway (predicted exonuclease)